MKIKLPPVIELPDSTPIVPLVSELHRVLNLEVEATEGDTVTFRQQPRARNVKKFERRFQEMSDRRDVFGFPQKPRMRRGSTIDDDRPPPKPVA